MQEEGSQHDHRGAEGAAAAGRVAAELRPAVVAGRCGTPQPLGPLRCRRPDAAASSGSGYSMLSSL